ncbi:hypothetical protein F511_44250 [Dorcoceras hygrometricum]|uniref:Uncharacterized protein n=1 Tax=Dorcoceras hygrometricum TaxID=472368 RepID=A0A2Z6ZYM7_9LAMI|nr:hypothetical protein F511_44250 [Dorcoceras hygrometricum]
MTNWFFHALSVIPGGSWGDVARRFTMIRWAPGSDQIHRGTVTSRLEAVDLLIRSTIGNRTPSSVCTRRSDEFDTNGISTTRLSEQVRSRQAAAARQVGGGRERRGGEGWAVLGG